MHFNSNMMFDYVRTIFLPNSSEETVSWQYQELEVKETFIIFLHSCSMCKFLSIFQSRQFLNGNDLERLTPISNHFSRLTRSATKLYRKICQDNNSKAKSGFLTMLIETNDTTLVLQVFQLDDSLCTKKILLTIN